MWPFKPKRIPKKITRSRLIELLPNAEFISCVDRVYSLPTTEEVLEALGQDTTTYQSEINDCDDFAYRAKGLATGRNWPFAVVHVPGHVMCGWVNDHQEWVWMEPQTRVIGNKGFSKIISIFI